MEETAGKWAPTDSRFRPDIRLLEEGTIGKYILLFMISYMFKRFAVILSLIFLHTLINVGDI
jgi:hypothetical protein